MKNVKKSRPVRIKWKHVLVIFLVLIVFQVFVSHMQQDTLRDLLSDTLQWYKQNSAEQIGNLTTTSLEILLESYPVEGGEDPQSRERNLVHALNSILRQPMMNRNVEVMCVIVPHKEKFITFDLGQSIYRYFYYDEIPDVLVRPEHEDAVKRYIGIHEQMRKTELTTSINEGQSIFHVYIPLVPYGEYGGAVYLRIHPDVTFISQQVLSTFNKTVIIFFSLILTGLLSMFYISTYIIIDRDEAREQLFSEHEHHLQEQVAQEKERVFAKRIYHTHHKAEKVMGFINEDIEAVNENNIKEIKYRIGKYANFISRVIYDMKWFNPPIQTIRSNLFSTNLNDVLSFIVNNIFLRLSYPVESIKFNLELDEKLPSVSVNEFVAWEIIEPLIQNAIDHSDKSEVIITLSTRYDEKNNRSLLLIEDNGEGIDEELLQSGPEGEKKIFLENITTKSDSKNKGYGCFLASEISKRCGWQLDVENREEGGARFILRINH